MSDEFPWVDSVTNEEIPGRIEAAERNLRYCERLFDRLKAEQARREAEAKRTVGERVAARLIRVFNQPDRTALEIGNPSPGRGFVLDFKGGAEVEHVVGSCQEIVAAAIDQADADARKQTREEIAAMVEACAHGETFLSYGKVAQRIRDGK